MKHDDTPKPVNPESIKQGYEVSDMGFKVILTFGIVISTATILSMIAMLVFFRGLERYAPSTSAYVPSPLASDQQAVIQDSAPVESDPVRDRLAIEEEAVEALHEYAWITEEGGVARIPIDAAIDMIVDQGKLPALAPIEAVIGPQTPQSAEAVPGDVSVPASSGPAGADTPADTTPAPVQE